MSTLSFNAAKNVVSKDGYFMSLAKHSCSKAINYVLLRNDAKEGGGSSDVYRPHVLDNYDRAVWGFNSPALWRIQKQEINKLFSDCVGENHCEVAVGTGLFLKDYTLDKEETKLRNITLIDMNQNTVDIARRRIADAAKVVNRDDITCSSSYILDITNPNAVEEAKIDRCFDSVAANFLMHCLHGTGLKDPVKYNAFKNCAALLKDDGVFFGSTILGHELLKDSDVAGPAAIYCLEEYNRFGIFGNKYDSLDDLTDILNELFEEVQVWQSGYCGVWKAKGARIQS